MTRSRITRRQFLALGSLAAAATALPAAISLAPRRVRSQEGSKDRRILFVVGASGGASISDSFLPLPFGEVAGDAETLIAYPDAVVTQPSGSALRCVAPISVDDLFVGGYDMVDFLRAHFADMVVLPVLNSSVNHIVAQKRAITGAGANEGKTIMELVAQEYGASQPLPNCNMAFGGYLEPGDDGSLPSRYRAEIIADPARFALSTHGSRGLRNAPPEDVIKRARAIRERLDDHSHFATTFRDSKRRLAYLTARRQSLPHIEAQDLIRSLMLLPDAPQTPLTEYGLTPLPSEERERLLEHFPKMLDDVLDAQGALAFLLAKYNVSSSISFGPGFMPAFLDNIFGTPLAFDFSHNDHVTTQHVMWGRILRVVDGLIRLLKAEDLDPLDPSQGKMWDKSLIYVATDFGREKTRPRGATQFGTGHHLNNGNLLISPLLRGNRVWGGIDPTTAETFGDRGDGVKTTFREKHVYSAIAQAMGIEFSGREDMSFMLKS